MMHHATITGPTAKRSLVTRQRFAAAGAALLVPLIPFALRVSVLKTPHLEISTINSLAANFIAVMIAIWIRFAVQTLPGTRGSAVVLPTVAFSHGIILAILLLTRMPYDRVSQSVGFIVHLLWLFGLYVAVHRRIRQRIGVVPSAGAERLFALPDIAWVRLERADLALVQTCDAIVADFRSLTDEWEAVLADAALDGRVVYQVKPLVESLTGRVEIDHLSENAFGYLVPMRAYAYLKDVGDWLFAVLMLPILVPVMAIIAVAIRLDSRGPAFFRQQRVGRRGKPITIYKFRTMRVGEASGDRRAAAMTGDDDPRITRVGSWLRRTRLDELAQVINILKGQMSWIGPRPEAEVLSAWYVGEIPFYRYRHVVKPGISGWAQVNQGHVADVNSVHEKLQYDFFYVKYFSLWLDLLIVFKTIRTMTSGFGAR